jgi:DNA repair protein RecO (recombination protein O)
MRQQKFIGLVIKRANFSEADKLVTIFTRESGKTTFVAKGVRRVKSRRSAHLELFNLVEVQVHRGRGFSQITEARAISCFPEMKSSLKQSAYLFYLAEMLDKIMPEEEPFEKIFHFITDSLSQMESVSASGEETVEKAIKQVCFGVLWQLGYLPSGTFSEDGLTQFLEKIVEKPIRSKNFLQDIVQISPNKN